MNDESKEKIELIARVAHEANRAYCYAIGDSSQPTWEMAPNWQIESCIAGVRASLSGSAKTPEESHKGWLDHKRAEGWSYGPIKDPVKKEHPCLVPYEELPESQKKKDVLFTFIVKALR